MCAAHGSRRRSAVRVVIAVQPGHCGDPMSRCPARTSDRGGPYIDFPDFTVEFRVVIADFRPHPVKWRVNPFDRVAPDADRPVRCAQRCAAPGFRSGAAFHPPAGLLHGAVAALYRRARPSGKHPRRRAANRRSDGAHQRCGVSHRRGTIAHAVTAQGHAHPSASYACTLADHLGAVTGKWWVPHGHAAPSSTHSALPLHHALPIRDHALQLFSTVPVARHHARPAPPTPA